MNPMTSAGTMASSVIPGGMSQVPLYPHTQPQVCIVPGNLHGLEPPVCTPPAQRTLKEGKTLGAIQILIGLLHVGLGGILGIAQSGSYTAISLHGGYPFWGGILFIISGSFSVSSEKQPKSSCLLNGSFGLNVVSAVCSMVGIVLFILDMRINPIYLNDSDLGTKIYGMSTSGILIIFSLLEFGVACTSAHFVCQLAYPHKNQPMVFQTVYVTNPVAIPAAEDSPPPYSSEVPNSK